MELDLETLTAEQKQDIIGHSHIYGMKRSDFVRLLDADQVLESELRMAKILEEEKSQHVSHRFKANGDANSASRVASRLVYQNPAAYYQTCHDIPALLSSGDRIQRFGGGGVGSFEDGLPWQPLSSDHAAFASAQLLRTRREGR